MIFSKLHPAHPHLSPYAFLHMRNPSRHKNRGCFPRLQRKRRRDRQPLPILIAVLVPEANSAPAHIHAHHNAFSEFFRPHAPIEIHFSLLPALAGPRSPLATSPSGPDSPLQLSPRRVYQPSRVAPRAPPPSAPPASPAVQTDRPIRTAPPSSVRSNALRLERSDLSWERASRSAEVHP